MRVVVRRWGNSLALRIPKALAEDSRLESGTEVDAAVKDGRLVITPIRSGPTLKDMLAAITDENMHPEVQTGRPVGREAW